ncbi:MAG TPA: Zn-ribbon domain-containing OB-fold protein [Methanoregulaceae archaeon]|nr:Zn-ribbon domain-containing OB-fold protein [Methanoregulaceae archaeon]HQJ88566.1 Zn-ribbon domain-containing OB-fold protein [Methanoregulaceae archaeon]
MSVPRFWRKIRQRYNLEGTRCTSCGRTFYPPRSFCPDCRRAGETVPFRFRGRGEIVTFTVIRTASDAFAQQTPFVLAIIQLEEGPRVTGQVVLEDVSEARIGMRVRPVFRRIGTEGESGVIYYGTKYVPDVPYPDA